MSGSGQTEKVSTASISRPLYPRKQPLVDCRSKIIRLYAGFLTTRFPARAPGKHQGSIRDAGR